MEHYDYQSDEVLLCVSVPQSACTSICRHVYMTEISLIVTQTTNLLHHMRSLNKNEFAIDNDPSNKNVRKQQIQ